MGCSLRVQKFVPGSEKSSLNITLTSRAFGEGFTTLLVCHGGQVAVKFMRQPSKDAAEPKGIKLSVAS